MAELLEHCWKLYRGKEEANEGDERARKSKTRIMELAALNPEIGARSISTHYLNKWVK